MRLCRGYLKGEVEVIEEEQRVSEQARPDLYNPSHVIQSLIDYAWRGVAWRGELSRVSVMQSFVTRFCGSGRTAYRVRRRWYSTQAPDKVSVTKTTKTESTSDDTPAIPPLRRPLGVLDVPTTKTKTLSERSADFLNQEKQLEKRRHLYVTLSTECRRLPHMALE